MSEKNNIEAFEEYLKRLDILYVEDEDAVRELIEGRLSKYFGKIYSAPNGEVGLYKFDAHRPKIVITDIRMPIMNGIEMLECIKEKRPDVKAVVTTAHSDGEYMLRSIDIGVEKYIVKPINVDALIAAVIKIATNLFHEEMAKEYQRQRLQNEIAQTAKSLFEQILSSLPSPVAVCSTDKTAFMNQKFTSLFNAEQIADIISQKITFDALFGIHPHEDVDTKRVEISISSGRKKIFEVAKLQIFLDDGAKLSMYHLKDLTKLEYKNAKLQNYADILCDVLKLKSKHTMEFGAQAGAQGTKMHFVDLLNFQELETLKRSHVYKTSAIEYTADIKLELLEELDELREIETEIDDLIDGIEVGDFRKVFAEIGKKFIAYSKAVGKLIDFEDLAVSVNSLGAYLANLPTNETPNWARLSSFVQNIRVDLSSWRKTIFVDKTAIDIHYLDGSLLSSCIQVRLGGTDSGMDFEDANELELF